MPLDDSILGLGIYTPRQAARILGTTPQEVLRWTRGSGPNEPIWHAHYQYLNDATEISFQDLIELRLVRALRKEGASLQAIRSAIVYCKSQLSQDRPLSSLMFKLDGKNILAESEILGINLISLSQKNRGQYVIKKLIDQSLTGLEYEGDHVVRWRAYKDSIVLDPKRQFGTPLIDKFGISSKFIYDDFLNIRSTHKVADIYEIPENLVGDAVSYERNLDAVLEEVNGSSTI